MPSQAMAQRVEAIPGTPLPFGLLSAATIIEVTDPHEMNGVVWQPLSCADAKTTDWCPDDLEEFDPAKEFDREGTVYAPPVTIYYGRDCTTVGETFEEAEAYVRAGLAIGEPRALERWVWENLLAPTATDRTPVGGAVGVPQGVATVEGFLAETYGGVGILHAPAGAAALLGQAHQLVKDGARMITWLGNTVVLGAGYQLNTGPNGDPAPDGQAWLYASGPVIIRRETVSVPGLQEREHVNILTNDRIMLAERVSVVGVECSVEAVLVELSCCC